MRRSCMLMFIVLLGCAPKKQKIFYLNSYHAGYTPSDQVEAGIVESFDPERYELTIFHLNAKRLSAAELEQEAGKAWDAIAAFAPDVLISSDDNAMGSVVVPHLNEISFPVLFCGVNWSAEKYHLPADKVTGMLEVLPVERCIQLIKNSGYPCTSITVLSENSAGEEKNKETLVPLFEQQGLAVQYQMVDDFEHWKEVFRESQTEGNILFLPTNGAIAGWDHAEAMQFVSEHMKVPVFTCDDFMVAYCAFGLTKVAREQGEWVAEKAKEILDGKQVDDISVTKNTQVDCYINDPLREQIELFINDSTINCKRYKNVK